LACNQVYARLPAHPEVLRTAMLVLSELAEWLNAHPDVLPPVWAYLLQVDARRTTANKQTNKQTKKKKRGGGSQKAKPVNLLSDGLPLSKFNLLCVFFLFYPKGTGNQQRAGIDGCGWDHQKDCLRLQGSHAGVCSGFPEVGKKGKGSSKSSFSFVSRVFSFF
jgi:hypothetical protein